MFSLHRSFTTSIFAAVLTTLGGVAARAQEPPTPLAAPLPIKQNFASGVNSWVAMGASAKVRVAPEPIKIGSANGALQFDYSVSKGELGGLILPVQPGTLARAKSFRFAVRSDYNSPIVVGLQEKDGGRYTATFAAPKDKWQIVELTPADFVLSEGKDDPKDPDNKLDLEQVESVGLLDLNQLFAQADSASLNDLFGVKTGAHTLYLADFTVSDAPLPGSAPAAATMRENRLDTFTHPQIGWVVIGGAQVAHTPESGPLKGAGMKVSYRQGPGKIVGLMHLLGHARLAGADRLTFSVASEKAVTLVVQVEEKSGGKYNTTISVPAGTTEATPISVAFTDFKAADDSKDNNGRLDLEDVTQIIFIDASGMSGDPITVADNNLYLGDLRAIKPAGNR